MARVPLRELGVSAALPALIFLVALLAYLPLERAMDSLLEALATFTPAEVLQVVRRQIEEVARGGHAGLLTIRIIGAVWSSSAAMVAIISTLNRAYDIEESRPWWRQRLTAILWTLAPALLVVLVHSLLLFGPKAAQFVTLWTGTGVAEPLWAVGRWLIVLVLIMLAIDVVYYVAPDADTEWVWLTPGSVLATGLWLATSYAFKWYVQSVADFNATYGALGGFVVLMLWFYLSGLAILIGGELNSEIDHASPYKGHVATPVGDKPKIGPAAERAHKEGSA